MSFVVLLDTNVLYPAHLRDTLLRLAERGLFVPRWSDEILEELDRNLLKADIPAAAIKRLTHAMNGAFADAAVEGYAGLVGSMTCDERDRHVLAAAVRADADALVTFNLRDFPEDSVDGLGIEVVHPDTFLLDLLDLAPVQVLDVLRAQAGANRRDPRTLTQLVQTLARTGLVEFAASILHSPMLRESD